ncbi:MAG: NUDIX domain-containing protein [Alphaproteobacteria bacterium]
MSQMTGHPASPVPVWVGGVSVICVRDGQILLCKRAEDYLHGEWTQIAGGIEPGETAVETALRELQEETGLTPEALYSADWQEMFYMAPKNRFDILPVFVAMIKSGAQVVLNEEHSDHAWLSVQDACSRVPFPGQRRMIRHVAENFIENAPPDVLRIPI